MQGRLEVASVVTICHVLPDSSDRAVPWIAIGELWEGHRHRRPCRVPRSTAGSGPWHAHCPSGSPGEGRFGAAREAAGADVSHQGAARG